MRVSPAPFSPVLWRTGIAVAALLAAAGVVRHGLATSLIAVDPLLAARLDDGNARVAVAAARAVADSPPPIDTDRVEQLTRVALQRDLTIPAAIEFRAVAAAGAGDQRLANHLFGLSSAISRRSLATRMWLIEQAVNRDDAAGALDNFDIALRTSNSAPRRLFPILASAAEDPVLTPKIAHVLDRKPLWAPEFLFYTIKQGHAPAAASLMLRMRSRASLAKFSLNETLIGQLIAEHRFAAARAVHAAFDPSHAPMPLLSDPRFDDPSRRYPFGWLLADSSDKSATRGNTGTEPSLALLGATGGAGTVASQLIMPQPGTYRLTVATAEAVSDAMAKPYWTVTCAGAKGAQLALLDQPLAAGASAAATFTIPKGCPAAWIALSLRPTGNPGGQSGAVAPIRIEPVP